MGKRFCNFKILIVVSLSVCFAWKVLRSKES